MSATYLNEETVTMANAHLGLSETIASGSISCLSLRLVCYAWNLLSKFRNATV